jgi:hypothetical protein
MEHRGFWKLRDESGAVAVLAAIMLSLLLGCVALAVDLGHLYVVKQELQNAADAGAMGGSRALIPYAWVTSPTPNWTNAQTTARQTVTANKADGTLLTDCQIQVGYWNLSTKELQSTAIVPTSLDVPAVKVTVAKISGQNGGPVQLFFARVFGKSLADVSAQAMAAVSGPSEIPPHSHVLPVAINWDMYHDYWLNPFAGSIRIGSSYHYPSDQAGQWTSFLVDSNNVPTIRDLIANGNPDELKIGYNIWIQPGTKTTLYSDVATQIGQTFIVPVVQTNFDTHAWTPILAFASLFIEDSVGGSEKYIQVHVVNDCPLPEASPGGPYWGSFALPKLIQ